MVKGWVGLNVGRRCDGVEVAKTIIQMLFGVAVGPRNIFISPDKPRGPNTTLTGTEVNFRPIPSMWCPQ